MNKEQRAKLHEDICMIMNAITSKLTKISKEGHPMTLTEMSEVADIIKDLAHAEKNWAKAHHYTSEHSAEVY